MQFLQNKDFGILIFRLFVGFAMAFAHGLGKVPPGEQLIGGVTAMGFPLPVVFAWAAALSELVGGVLIGFGLFTRLSSLALGFTMAVAAFLVHAADPFQQKELAFFYLVSCIMLIFTGAGKYSLDKVIRKVN
ncbi:MAG: DoxX family protein [Bdellovibrionia bacterium]